MKNTTTCTQAEWEKAEKAILAKFPAAALLFDLLDLTGANLSGVKLKTPDGPVPLAVVVETRDQ